MMRRKKIIPYNRELKELARQLRKNSTLSEEHTPNPPQEGINNQNGIALVVTLLALVIITAMVVEFSYGVYTGTNNLYNWRDSQRLSIMAKSGVNVSTRFLSEMLRNKSYSYPGFMEMPVENPFEDFAGVITVRIEDENAKFNINSIVPDNQIVDKNNKNSPYNVFKRLLENLSLDENIADRVRDWIDKDIVAELSDSEDRAKNAALISVDELLLIHGISREDYDTLLPYITVYGDRNIPQININGAEKPVLRCLSDDITDDLAQRVIDYRKINPFDKEESQLQNVNGFTSTIYNPISQMITIKGTHFSVTSTASSEGVKRIITTVLNATSSPPRVEYWKEY
jgi:general secretion pathway protein K